MTCLVESPPREGTQTGVLPPILGTSRALREAVELARRVAASDLPVLLIGPTGCGKELFAQHIHALERPARKSRGPQLRGRAGDPHRI